MTKTAQGGFSDRRAGNRRLPIGAELHGNRAYFRVWAPKRRQVLVRIDRQNGDREEYALPAEDDGKGYFSGDASAAAGDRYWFRLDSEHALRPDPASRFQPEGPHGPSELIDPAAYVWHDGLWTGPSPENAVLYEMHLGTFTPKGTWQAAEALLSTLAELGTTIVEIMPIADFAGRFGWGYDGVDLFAPSRLYGWPDDARRFIDHAHALGIGVILDVVYNHFGPDGNYLQEFSDDYVTDRYKCEWGEPLNYDGKNAHGVRDFILANVEYWIAEFHFDGLRLDATQQIFDASPTHILQEVGRVARDAAARVGRRVFIACENEPQDTDMVRRDGFAFDVVWNDDFHHSARIAASGQNRAYLSGYLGTPQELVSAAKYGFLYQGQHYKWQGKRRGSPSLDLEPRHFVNFLQNHDQVANNGFGLRLDRLTSFGRLKALTALFLLMPGTPMLFQGQEFAASSPFMYFADHRPELAALVRQGRTAFVSQFPNLAAPDAAPMLPDPGAIETFRQCALDHEERRSGQHAQIWALHRDLIRLRRQDAVFSQHRRGTTDGAVLGVEAFVLRCFGSTDDRLLIVNLGRDIRLEAAAEPLLAPRLHTVWQIMWSTEDAGYGGTGTPPIETEDHWLLPGHAAVVLQSVQSPCETGANYTDSDQVL